MMKANNNNNLSVSLIGLGSMGSALAGTLIDKGFKITIWNRDLNKAQPLIHKGAELASSAAEAIAASPVTIMCVSNYNVSTVILAQEGITEALENKTFIQLSTGTPKEARDMEALISSKGVAYLDGSILAWPSHISGEETTILVSGKKPVFENIEPIMKALAGNLIPMGEAIGGASSLFAAVLAYLAG
jgi:3-hydroxyisobutyrate dehydrogenase-like beta-hydroxyacid dehydrogenase